MTELQKANHLTFDLGTEERRGVDENVGVFLVLRPSIVRRESRGAKKAIKNTKFPFNRLPTSTACPIFIYGSDSALYLAIKHFQPLPFSGVIKNRG